MKPLLLALLLVALTSIGTPPQAAAESAAPMVYRYWDWSLTNSRDDYQVAALALALEKTANDYGPFEIQRQRFDFTNARLVREVLKGELINLHAAPAYSPLNRLYPHVQQALIPVQVPLLDGLLGYRQLIVRREHLKNFEDITPEQLKQQVAGQGKEWEDSYIYRHNNFRVNETADYASLLNMLIAGRFDYLPMSVIEVQNVIAQAEDTHQLAIVDGLLLYYPLPVYFYVSKEHPGLAQRLEKGLAAARADGSLQKLLRQHFPNELALLQKKKMRLITLEHPSIGDIKGSAQPQLFNASSKPL